MQKGSDEGVARRRALAWQDSHVELRMIYDTWLLMLGVVVFVMRSHGMAYHVMQQECVLCCFVCAQARHAKLDTKERRTCIVYDG